MNVRRIRQRLFWSKLALAVGLLTTEAAVIKMYSQFRALQARVLVLENSKR